MTKQDSRSPQNADPGELLKLYIDVYKHHYDLWLKGYAVYLAIIGTAAGLIFGKDTSPDMRKFLLLFATTVSAISSIAWVVGLGWATRFSRALDGVSTPHSPPLAIGPFRVFIVLGLVGALIILAGAAFLYFRSA